MWVVWNLIPVCQFHEQRQTYLSQTQERKCSMNHYYKTVTYPHISIYSNYFSDKWTYAINLCGYKSTFIIYDFGSISRLVTHMYTCCITYSHRLIFGKMFYMQSNFVHDNKATSENCALLSYYTASCGNFSPNGDNLSVPERWKEITTTRCVIAQKSAVLIYFVAETWNQGNPCFSDDKLRINSCLTFQ